MDAEEFRPGEQVWLKGRQVTFVECSLHGSRFGAAVVRRENEAVTRVVPLWKLARNRAESLAREYAIPIT